MIIAAALVILIAVPSIAMFSGMFYNTYESMAKNKLDRSVSASRMFIDSIMTTNDNLALNPVVVETLNGSRTGSLSSVLDGACTYSLSIDAITVYGTDGKIYTSSGVYNPPTIEELKENQSIFEFFADSEAVDYVSLRVSEIARAYGNTPYDESAGIISCCRKIYAANGETAGYIFSDIFPKNLFEYFAFSDDARLNDGVAMLSFDGGAFLSQSLDDARTYLTAASDTVVKNRLVISSIRNFYGGTVSLAVSVAPLYSNIAAISAIIVLCGVLLLVATHFAARKISCSVAARLNNLLEKMTFSTQRFNS